ncbi:MAG: type II secretion system protein GspG [Candidatus Shapirobacteria bacterium]
MVELLIVIAIIGVLAGIGISSYIGQLARARDSRRKADLEQIRSALEMCRADVGSYPNAIYPTVVCGNTYLTTPSDPLGSQYGYTPGYTLCIDLESPVTTYCVYPP